MYMFLTIGILALLGAILFWTFTLLKYEDYSNPSVPGSLPSGTTGDVLIHDGEKWVAKETKYISPNVGTKISSAGVEIGKIKISDSGGVQLMGVSNKKNGITLGIDSALTVEDSTGISINTDDPLKDLVETPTNSYIPVKYNGKLLWIPTIRP